MSRRAKQFWGQSLNFFWQQPKIEKNSLRIFTELQKMELFPSSETKCQKTNHWVGWVGAKQFSIESKFQIY